MELISIVLPSFNRGFIISSAIKSVISQTYHYWELLIIDDGSTDSTFEVVKEFIKLDSRIFYSYQENRGASSARNLGILKAKGKYITFLDSDDEFHPCKLEYQFNSIKKFKVGISLCYSLVKKNNEILWRKRPLEVKNLKHKLLAQKPNVFSGTPLLFVDIDLIRSNNIFFDESLPAMEDFDFFISISKFSSYCVVKEFLYTENMFFIERVSSMENIFLARLLLFKKYRSFFKSQPFVGFYWIRKTVSMYLYNDFSNHKNLLFSICNSIFEKFSLMIFIWLLHVFYFFKKLS